ncbi:MAG: hypothetical protein ACRDH7_12750 [Actinomycetota bacterium]
MRLRIRFPQVLAVTIAFVALTLSTPIAANAATCTCSMSLSAASGLRGSSVLITGTGFTVGGTVRLQFVDSASVRTLVAKNVAVASDGTFSVTVTIPASAALGAGKFNANEKVSAQRAKAPFTVTGKHR